jgi:hypothetical protein
VSVIGEQRIAIGEAVDNKAILVRLLVLIHPVDMPGLHQRLRCVEFDCRARLRMNCRV